MITDRDKAYQTIQTDYRGGGYNSADTAHIANMLEAVVHAQLEVAEQLRIANVIALSKAGVDSARLGLIGDSDSATLLPNVAASLGLEEGTDA